MTNNGHACLTHPDSMNYCCNEPWQTQTQEYIDRVAARHIPHSIVSIFLLHRGSLGSEGVGQRCPQSNEGDSWGSEGW